jgi:hypothetical protein
LALGLQTGLELGIAGMGELLMALDLEPVIVYSLAASMLIHLQLPMASDFEPAATPRRCLLSLLLLEPTRPPATSSQPRPCQHSLFLHASRPCFLSTTARDFVTAKARSTRANSDKVTVSDIRTGKARPRTANPSRIRMGNLKTGKHLITNGRSDNIRTRKAISGIVRPGKARLCNTRRGSFRTGNMTTADLHMGKDRFGKA